MTRQKKGASFPVSDFRQQIGSARFHFEERWVDSGFPELLRNNARAILLGHFRSCAGRIDEVDQEVTGFLRIDLLNQMFIVFHSTLPKPARFEVFQSHFVDDKSSVQARF
jgi:hypothetical protein